MKIKRILVMAAVIFAAWLLQYGLFPLCPWIDTVPNLLLIVTVSFGFMKGKKHGMAVGFFCGLTADIASMGTLGFYMAAFILAGYLNGAFHRWMYSDYIVFPLIVTGFTSLLYGSYVYLFEFLVRGRLDFVYYLLHVIIPESLYTVILTAALYPFLSFINRRLELTERRSATKFV